MRESSNLFIQIAAGALQGDRLSRLVRILEDSTKTASFWYLYRCEPNKVGQGIDVDWLKDFSKRIKQVRDKVFAHIDKDAVFDPQKIYKDANIKISDIRKAIDVIWSVLHRVNSELRGGGALPPKGSIDDLKDGIRRDLLQLLSSDR